MQWSEEHGAVGYSSGRLGSRQSLEEYLLAGGGGRQKQFQFVGESGEAEPLRPFGEIEQGPQPGAMPQGPPPPGVFASDTIIDPQGVVHEYKTDPATGEPDWTHYPGKGPPPKTGASGSGTPEDPFVPPPPPGSEEAPEAEPEAAEGPGPAPGPAPGVAPSIQQGGFSTQSADTYRGLGATAGWLAGSAFAPPARRSARHWGVFWAV